MTSKPSNLNTPLSPAMQQRLTTIQGYVFDMDGTLILGNKHGQGFSVLPGAIELLQWLRQNNIPFIVFTNGTARPPRHYAAQLREAGLDVGDTEMMTPATCAADVFSQKNYKKVMVMGGDGLSQPLQEVGLETCASRGQHDVDAVFAGWFREFGMEDLEAAYYAVTRGANFYSASEAPFFATASGPALGTSRVISAMIKDVTGCEVHVVGKPAQAALQSAAKRLQLPASDIAVVGDDPELEVPMALKGGSLAIAVTTGLATADTYRNKPADQQPDLLLDNVASLLRHLQ